MSHTASSPHTSAATTQGLLQALHWRYATKVFNPSQKLSAQQWAALEEALVLTPSSYGLQPWRFVVVQDAALRAQLKPASWNQGQITDCSHLVVFAAKVKMEAKDIEHYIETICKVRGVPASAMDGYKQMMLGDIVNGPRSQWAPEWAARQCYIALGNLMTSAAMIGVDTCPLEGIDPAAYDKLLNLAPTGYKTVVACAVGFRAAEDKYASMKKVRYSASEVVIKR